MHLKYIKICEFLYIYYWRWEKQGFKHVMLYYFRSNKTAAEKQKKKKFVQCMEKVL